MYSAFVNTQNQNICSYTIHFKYKSFSSSDTIHKSYEALIDKANNSLDFYLQLTDTTSAIYFNELYVFINNNDSTYKIQSFPITYLLARENYLYRPLLDSDLYNLINSNTKTVTSLTPNEEFTKYNLELNTPNSVDTLSFSFIIDKEKNIISKYSMYAEVAGLSEYKEWTISILNKCNRPISPEDTIENIFYSTLKRFSNKTYSDSKAFSNLDSTNIYNEAIHHILPFLILIDTKNDTIRLANYNSQYYLVDYWYIGCPPCIKSLPILKDINNTIKANDLRIISINTIDRDSVILKDFLLENDITYPVITGSVDPVNWHNKIRSYPTYVLYDSRFKVIKIIRGYDDQLKNEILDAIND